VNEGDEVVMTRDGLEVTPSRRVFTKGGRVRSGCYGWVAPGLGSMTLCGGEGEGLTNRLLPLG
jgi:hypothetical protein